MTLDATPMTEIPSYILLQIRWGLPKFLISAVTWGAGLFPLEVKELPKGGGNFLTVNFTKDCLGENGTV